MMKRGDGSVLGMIVDRSSFDDDDMSRSCVSFDEGGIQKKNGRVRRKLKWKPPGLSLRREKQQPSSSSSNESIRTVGDRSVRSSKTDRSFHTFNSTETPVLSNKKSQKPPTNIPRPSYPDTFEGVSTIENEARLVHSRMAHADSSSSSSTLSRSHTMPCRPEEIEMMESPSDGSGSFDPYDDHSKIVIHNHNAVSPSSGVVEQPTKKPAKKPSLRALARSAAKRNPRMSTRPPVHRSRPPMTAKMSQQTQNESLTTDSQSSEEMHMEEIFPILTGDDFEPDRRIDFMHSSVMSGADAAASAAGVSPMKECSIQHQVTPESSASKLKSPMQSPTETPTPTSRRVQNKHIAKPVPARVALDHESVKLKTMTIQSALQNEEAFKATRYDSPSRRPYSRTQNNMAVSFHDSPCSSRNGDAMSPPDSPKHATTIVSNTGVEHVAGSSLSTKGYVMSDETSGAKTPSPRRPRSSGTTTGPVDVDQARFLEAERNLKAIHQMAAEHLAHGEYEEALEVFEEILLGQRERYGNRHYRVGTALHNIGIVHLKSKRYDKAIKVCREAVRVRKEALVPNHPDVAVSLAQLGVAHLECQQHREALIAFREALQIRREFLGPKHPKVGKILNNVGCALYELEELQGAKHAFEEALEIQRETLRTSPAADDEETGVSTNQALLSIASTLCNLASIELRWGNFEEASVALEEALLIQQSVLGDDHPAVLSTIESIDFVDKSMNRKNGVRSKIFGLFGDSEPVFPRSAQETLDSIQGCSDQPDKIANLKVLVACGLDRSQQMYENLENFLLPATTEVCGPIGHEEVLSVESSISSASTARRRRAEILRQEASKPDMMDYYGLVATEQRSHRELSKNLRSLSSDSFPARRAEANDSQSS